MLGLFNPDNKINIFIGKIGDVIIANLLFIFCCIPFFTIGASYTALHFCCLRLRKGNLNGVTKTFFNAFFKNFKQATITWIGILIGIVFLLTGIRFLKQMGGSFANFYLYIYYAAFILLTLFTLYVFPVIATFENTLKKIYSMSISLCFMHFPKTILIAFFTIFPFVLTYSDLRLISLYAFLWAFFGFALITLISDYFFFSIFKNIYLLN
ncbi:hypothetical protein P261_01040 [Lachnospiraceae bacterium TWA4]|nr:hypothetical protein P261_01040 [Lachnospiraceae bacterium TWA4]